MDKEKSKKSISCQRRKMINRDRTINRLCDDDIELKKLINSSDNNKDELIRMLNENKSYNDLSQELKNKIDDLEYKNPELYYKLFPLRKLARKYQDDLRIIFNY